MSESKQRATQIECGMMLIMGRRMFLVQSVVPTYRATGKLGLLKFICTQTTDGACGKFYHFQTTPEKEFLTRA